MVNAWNVGELDEMTLPPCHYGFQCYTRELSESERFNWYCNKIGSNIHHDHIVEEMNQENVPTRALSLKWNQRSVDTPLGLPFNIASYGLLLEILAKEVNMVPDDLIGSLGDCHIYLDQIDGIKEQIGQEMSIDDRMDWWFKNNKPNRDVCDYVDLLPINSKHVYFDEAKVPKKTREPFPLPTVKHMKSDAFYKALSENQSLYSHLENDDFKIEGYESHSIIKLPLSN
jgi:thymidylate synthase